MASKDTFRHESLEDTKSIARYLTALADGIGNGNLVLGNDADQFTVTPEGLLKLEIKAKRKSGEKVKVEFEISWKEHTDSGAPSGSLIIEPGRQQDQ